ncbi:uncharacterized protein LOC111716386 [Eurytemora carolleeae]|uniref:uncharacterized protein LOC111716386 n=1 Tax=Eurytemora carolleeae TaxID=1294199 RepID=UPI000C762684|nr:uncharacterized protein LOC111716386 [Eurytemora carolleeae]|eukprot:XP_023347599.1 uncharacterized protein LOC111716386 [Eurytemora affinis]
MSEKYMNIGAPMTELPLAQSRAHSSLSHRGKKLRRAHSLQDRLHLSFYSRAQSSMGGAAKFHDSCQSVSHQNMNGFGSRDAPLQKGESPLRICSLTKEEFQISKDAKFSPGIQVSCPYLYCNSKNSQFQNAGRFPSAMVYCNKRYFYLEAQSYVIDGHPELFLWLWFLGSDSEEIYYRYNLTVIHGKSEYSYKGPVISLMRSATEVRNEGRCLVIREKVWDYMSYKLRIVKV